MAVVYMVPVNISSYKLGQSDNIGYQYSTGNITGNGNAIVIPDNVNSISINLKVSGGSGRIEYTLDSVEAVEAETADWKVWDWGNVTADQDDVFYPCTAIRGVQISGLVSCQVRCNG